LIPALFTAFLHAPVFNHESAQTHHEECELYFLRGAMFFFKKTEALFPFCNRPLTSVAIL
jgi:hypothetical protein